MDSLLDTLLNNLANSGMIGTILAIMLWFNYRLVTKLFTVIETNTKALTINNEKLSELGTAQMQRRKDFGHEN